MRNITDTRTGTVYAVEKYRVRAGKVSFESDMGEQIDIPVARAIIGNRVEEDAGLELAVQIVDNGESPRPSDEPVVPEASADEAPTPSAEVLSPSAPQSDEPVHIGSESVDTPVPRQSIKPDDRDRSWKNAKVRLSTTPQDSLQTFYRARFEITAEDVEDVEIWPQIVMVLQEWLEEKEGRRDDRGQENLLIPLTSNLEVYSKRFKKTNQKCYLSARMVKGSFSEECASSFLATSAEIGNGSDLVPQYWAMEYIERDNSKGWRRWVTKVGITALENGVYAVNAFVGYYDDPTYVYDVVSPKRNVPRFVGELIEIDKCIVRAGSTVLASEAKPLNAESMQQFVADLTSKERTVPLVVIASELSDAGEERYHIEPSELARLLRGVAVVFFLNRNDSVTEVAYRKIFGDAATPAYQYRVEPGALRMYWPGVDLISPEKYAYALHRFIPGDQLAACNAFYVMQNIAQGISRAHTRKHGEVSDRASVEAQRARIVREGLLRARKALSERLGRENERRREAEKRVNEAQTDTEKLAKLSEENEQLLEELEEALEQNEKLNNFIETADVGLEAELREKVDELRAMEDVLYDEVDKLGERARAAEEERDSLKYNVAHFEEENKRLRRRNEQTELLADLVLDMGSYIDDASAAIMLAKQAFGDKLRFLPEAYSSANEFKGDVGDMFTALAKMAEVLWVMRFEEGKLHIDENEYRARTGYEIAFGESKQTNRNAEFRKLRTRLYEGQEIDISPHVKGGSRRDGLLRIHFYIDDERQYIVIGHCGEHLKSAGTQYR